MIWVETNDDSCETYNTNSQIKLETLILQSSLCDYWDAYKPCKGKIIKINKSVGQYTQSNI